MKVHRKLERLGLRLSPVFSKELAKDMRRSRLVLNLRTYRYDNCEIPRMVVALSNGRIVVSESTFGLSESLEMPFIDQWSYSELPEQTLLALKDPNIEERSRNAWTYMREDYLLCQQPSI